jgi:hypothetical protein
MNLLSERRLKILMNKTIESLSGNMTRIVNIATNFAPLQFLLRAPP